MPKGNGGLGNNPKNSKKEDLLDSAFFGAEKAEAKYTNKLFKIEETTLKKVKLYGIEHGMKEYEVINLALTRLFEAEE